MAGTPARRRRSSATRTERASSWSRRRAIPRPGRARRPMKEPATCASSSRQCCWRRSRSARRRAGSRSAWRLRRGEPRRGRRRAREALRGVPVTASFGASSDLARQIQRRRTGRRLPLGEPRVDRLPARGGRPRGEPVVFARNGSSASPRRGAPLAAAMSADPGAPRAARARRRRRDRRRRVCRRASTRAGPRAARPARSLRAAARRPEGRPRGAPCGRAGRARGGLRLRDGCEGGPGRDALRLRSGDAIRRSSTTPSPCAAPRTRRGAALPRLSDERDARAPLVRRGLCASLSRHGERGGVGGHPAFDPGGRRRRSA